MYPQNNFTGSGLQLITVTPQHAIFPTVIFKNFGYNLLKLGWFFFSPLLALRNIDDLGKTISILPQTNRNTATKK